MGGTMVSKRLSIYGFISAAAVISGVLAGCGGSSNSIQPAAGTVSTTGGLTTTSQSLATGVPASTSPQQVQVTGGPAILPAGQTIVAGQPFAVIPAGTPFIQGLSGPKKGIGAKSAPTTGAAGSIYVNGQDTGDTITASGALAEQLILTASSSATPGSYTVIAYGPFTITGSTASFGSTTELTVGKFIFNTVVLPDGTCGIPSVLNGNLPANGGSLAHGSFVAAGYPAEFASTYYGALYIVYAGVTVSKSQQLITNSDSASPLDGLAAVTFNALNGHPGVPTTGVDSVTFTLQTSP